MTKNVCQLDEIRHLESDVDQQRWHNKGYTLEYWQVHKVRDNCLKFMFFMKEKEMCTYSRHSLVGSGSGLLDIFMSKNLRGCKVSGKNSKSKQNCYDHFKYLLAADCKKKKK